MALTTCPECKGKVSDTAKACPHCGFDINSNKEANRIVNEISEIPFPNNPICTITGVIEIIVTIISLTIGTILSYMIIKKTHIDGLWAVGIGLFVFAIIQSPFIGKFLSLVKEYNLAKTNFPEYQKQKYIQQKDNEEAAQYFGLLIGISISGFILYVIIRLLVKALF